RKNQLVRPVARIEPHQRPEGRGRGIALLLEQLGGGEIRQGPRPLRVGKRAGLPAQQALAQQRHRGIVLELLIGADALLQQIIGRLRRQPCGRGHEERERRQRTRHRQRSTSVMSVIRSRWPAASSIIRSYGRNPSRSTRRRCDPDGTWRSICGVLPTGWPSMYTLPHGIELTDSSAGSEDRGAGRATRGGAEVTAGVVRRTTGVRLIGAGFVRRAVSRWGTGGGGLVEVCAGCLAG